MAGPERLDVVREEAVKEARPIGATDGDDSARGDAAKSGVFPESAI
jgi:hypothetical protein